MAESLPLISVIIPAFNAEAFVGETLASVGRQTYRNIEVVVVDDGSTDGTAEIVEAEARRDGRFRLLRQAHKGVAAARNLAIAESAGEYIAPLDADDIWHPENLERQARCLRALPNTVGLVYAASVCIDERGRPIGGLHSDGYSGNVLLELICSNFLANASSPLIRRTCLDRVGGYADLRKYAQGSEDWDLYLRIAEQYEFGVVPEILIGYRQARGSLSASYRAMEASHARVIKEGRHEIRKKK